MGNLIITSTEPGEGKTAVAATLAHRAAAAGRSSAAVSPFCSSGIGGPQDDSQIFDRLVGTQSPEWPPVAPGEALAGSDLDDVSSSVNGLAADMVAVEVSSELSQVDCVRLADALDAKILIVVRHRHGMTADDILERTVPYGDRLAGILLNCRGPYLGTESSALMEDLEAAGIRVFGAVPDERRLLAVTVRQMAEHLSGRILQGEDGADQLVEHFLVGGWMLDEGARYFGTRTDKAVVVRGDRPDLQMSALGTPTKVVVLTNGIAPIEYVLYEAREEETPLLSVQGGTIAVMEALGSMADNARFDHPGKLARMSDLMDSHADAAALDGLA